MSTSLRMGAVTIIVLAVTGVAAFAAEDVKGREAVTNVVSTVLVAEKAAVPLGDPIKVSLSVRYQGEREANLDKTAATFDCFQVTDPDGQPVGYVGWDGQVQSTSARVRPSATVTIVDGLDLTDNYVFRKTGRYSIQFRGARGLFQTTSLPSSNRITVDVTPGQLSEFDQLAVCLLPACPKGWRLVKDSRGEVAPFGRSRVAGLALHVCHNHMHGEAVYLWFTKAETKIDPDQEPRLKSEYLGRARGLYVYAAVDGNTPPLWPTATEDISRALKFEISANRAAQLAAELANAECERRYHRRPFRPEQHTAVLENGKYWWGGLDVGGPGGYSALVTFASDGSHPKVEVYFSTDTF